jgi:hypothetical protein
VRLDHLLSKELLQFRSSGRLPEPLLGRMFRGGLLKGGTLMMCCRIVPVSQYARLRVGSLAGVGMVACTLLGPEGSTPLGRGRSCKASTVVLVGRFLGLLALSGCGRWAGECRPYVENYTVDASIFDSTSQHFGAGSVGS